MMQKNVSSPWAWKRLLKNRIIASKQKKHHYAADDNNLNYFDFIFEDCLQWTIPSLYDSG